MIGIWRRRWENSSCALRAAALCHDSNYTLISTKRQSLITEDLLFLTNFVPADQKYTPILSARHLFQSRSTKIAFFHIRFHLMCGERCLFSPKNGNRKIKTSSKFLQACFNRNNFFGYQHNLQTTVRLIFYNSPTFVCLMFVWPVHH